jgi:hypothetical protein
MHSFIKKLQNFEFSDKNNGPPENPDRLSRLPHLCKTRKGGSLARRNEGLVKTDGGPPRSDGGLSRKDGGKSRRIEVRSGASGSP